MKKKNLILSIIAFTVAASLIGGVYYWVLLPTKSELTAKKEELQNEESYLKAIQGNSTSSQELNIGTATELQKKLPVEPLVQQLVLDLEKAEVLSNSFIKNVSIDEEVETNSDQEVEEETQNENTNYELEENLETDEDINSQQESTSVLPSGLKKVTLSLNVQSPTYSDLELFLSTIESMQRIMIVESFSFNGEEEITSIEQTRQALSYSVVISAYYAPALEDLKEDLPQMEASESSGKTNPLSTGSTSINN